MTDYPTVSVVTITYGHEKYITQTLDSVLMQNYRGEVEFIIANDNSPDSTDEVIRNYLSAKNISSNFSIKYTKHEENKGMSSNFVWALQQASGKYIAVCEGDDYWTDNNKLRMQVNFLEGNKDYVLCFTNRNILKNNVLEISEPLHKKKSFNKSEIASTKIATLTIVFRNMMGHFPIKMNNTLIDGTLFLFLSQFGLFYYFDQAMGVYRIHDEGIWSGSSILKNYNRSVNTRISAWRNLHYINRPSLAESLLYWISLRRNEELRNKMYLLALRSRILEWYFTLYIRREVFITKFKLAKNRIKMTKV